jgi:hypothetical protein
VHHPPTEGNRPIGLECFGRILKRPSILTHCSQHDLPIGLVFAAAYSSADASWRCTAASFTIGMSEDDLRVIAKHGYEGVLSTDPDQRARTLSLLIADMLAARRPGNGVTAVATSNGFV